jgi:diketogulonate reductase-like aldo/keto reductase
MTTTKTVQSDLRYTTFPLNNKSGAIPAMGFGTLIADLNTTRNATKAALETGFRAFDCAERYRNEQAVGEALRDFLKEGQVPREELFVASKLWNCNHRPERVRPAFEASRNRLGLDYLDLYLIHTPFAFQPGDEQDPRDANGNIIYDKDVTLLDTWRAMESLVDEGRCKAIGLSDVDQEQLGQILSAARIKPAVLQVESHLYYPQWNLLDFCKGSGVIMQAFAALGHAIEPRLLDDPIITAIAQRIDATPAQVLLAWAVQRGTALLTTSTKPNRIKENFDISALPEDALKEINGKIKTRVTFNAVIQTGIPGFIPRGK